MLSYILLSLSLGVSPSPREVCNAVVSVTTASQPSYKSSLPDRLKVCQGVVVEGLRQGVEPVLLAVLAWEESRWEPEQENPKTKVIGPLQVQPRWWCESTTRTNCDWVVAGVSSVKHYLTTHALEGEVMGLCHFNQGNVCGNRALRRARFIYREILAARRFLTLSPRV